MMISAKTAAQLTMANYTRRVTAEAAAKLVNIDQLINATVCQGTLMYLCVEYDDYNLPEIHDELKALGYRLSQNQPRGKPRTLTISWGHQLSEGG